MIILIIINFFLFSIGMGGILFNKKNIIVVLINLELILLSCNLNGLIFSLYLDDIMGELLSLILLSLSACETALGLSLIICYYKTYQYI